MNAPPISSDEIFEALNYDSNTGTFYWKARRGIQNGRRAGRLGKAGYERITINGVCYYTHKLVYFIHTTLWPSMLDHIDGCRTNNRFSNLRQSCPTTNSQNSKRRRDNNSGFKGVTKIQSTGRYRAVIKIGGTQKHLGVFDSAEDAFASYRVAATLYFGAFARFE